MEKLTTEQVSEIINKINEWIKEYKTPNSSIVNKFILRYDILSHYAQVVNELRACFKDKDSLNAFINECNEIMSSSLDSQIESITLNDLVNLIKIRKDVFNYLIKLKPYLADYDFSQAFNKESEEYKLMENSDIIKIVKKINDFENNKITFQDVNPEYLLDADILSRVRKFTKDRIIQYTDNKFKKGNLIGLKSEINSLCEEISHKIVSKLKIARKMLDSNYTTLSLFDDNTLSHYVDLTTEYSMLKKQILTKMSFRDYIEKSLNLLYEINILKAD